MGFEGVDSTQAVAAVRKLASFRDAKSSSFLLEIALGDNPFLLPDVRDEAIKALGRRGDPSLANALAGRLQLYQTLGNRKALAQALLGMKCEGQCLRSILHYLERVYRGELNFEDRLDPSDGEFKQFAEREQLGVVRNLYETLSKNPQGTLDRLSTVYGLGSQNPSTFALDLVSELQLKEACPVLRETLQQLQESAIPGYVGPVSEIRELIVKLGCKP